MTYESDTMAKLFPNHSHQTRCVDEDVQFENSRRVAGYGGVSTIWTDKMNPYAKRRDEGNARIVVTTFSIPGSPICVINCYLPSGQSKEAVETFLADIDKLHVIIYKYSTEFEVIVIGDLNEDHFNRSSNKEKRTRKLINDLDLIDLGEACKEENTYYNPFLQHKSHIDQVLVKHVVLGITWTDTVVLPHNDP